MSILKIQFRQETAYAGRWFVIDSSGHSPFNDFNHRTCEEFVDLVYDGYTYGEAIDQLWDTYLAAKEA